MVQIAHAVIDFVPPITSPIIIENRKRPVGTGTVKAVVNIFGARQFHPILQRSLIETFYVKFYMIINIGACLGFMIMPIVARMNITVAYTIPLALLLVALASFAVGYARYVHVVPVGRRARGGSRGERSGDRGGVRPRSRDDDDARVAADDDEKPNFGDVAKVCLLIIPFSIVYQQCPTTCKQGVLLHYNSFFSVFHHPHITPLPFVEVMVQGAVMEPFLGVIEAPSINILDSK